MSETAIATTDFVAGTIRAANPPEPHFDQVSIGMDPAGRTAEIFVGSNDGRWERIGTASDVRFDMHVEQTVSVVPPDQRRSCDYCGISSAFMGRDYHYDGSVHHVCRECHAHRHQVERDRARWDHERRMRDMVGLDDVEKKRTDFNKVVVGPTSDQMEDDYRV